MMPQATEELRKEWGDGPYGVGEQKAIEHLEGRGYILTRAWQWKLPLSIAWPTLKDFRAMEFLIQEWDFGGLEPLNDAI